MVRVRAAPSTPSSVRGAVDKPRDLGAIITADNDMKRSGDVDGCDHLTKVLGAAVAIEVHTRNVEKTVIVAMMNEIQVPPNDKLCIKFVVVL